MDIKHIVVNRKQFSGKLRYLILITLFSGIWLGVVIKNFASEPVSSESFPWIELISFIVLLIFWFVFIVSFNQAYKKWHQKTSNWVRAQGQSSDDDMLVNREAEQARLAKLSTCRHEKLTGTLKELHSLMTRHLNNVTSETNEAALALINQLKLIHQAMSHLLETVSTNRKESDEIASDSQTTLEDNQETMDRLQTYINGRLQEIDHDHQMASELQQQAVIMSDLTKLIESVARQTTIVATNAKIEASRAGKHGRTFGVIADEVTKLSAQIGYSSKQIIQSIDHMGKSIEEKFKAKLDKAAQAEETDLLNGLKNQLVKMGVTYTQLEKFNRGTLERINSSSENIKSKVNDSLTAIQFQDITQQQIEVILKSLQLFEKFSSEQTCFDLASEKGEHDEEFDINQIRNLYVMKKQHDIHNQHRKFQRLTRVEEKENDIGDITMF